MKVAIVGSRTAEKKVAYKILSLLPENTTEIVSGGADGVDQVAELIAKTIAVPLKIFKPDYKKFGKFAPLERNMEIIKYADYVMAFWDGKSKGTRQVITKCIETGKRIKIVQI